MTKDSLVHAKWNCKYYISFTPKYRRQAMLGKLCEFKEEEIEKDKM